MDFTVEMQTIDATLNASAIDATASAGTLAASLEDLMGEPHARILAEEAYMEAETTPAPGARVFWTAYAAEICRRGALFALVSDEISEGVADLVSRLNEDEVGMVGTFGSN